MAFNFGGFVGGFSSKVVERFEEEERRAEELAKEQRSIATRQRAAREEEKRKREIIAEETLGMLNMLGYDDKTASSIMEKGISSAQFAVEAGQKAMAKGVDPNSIFNFASITGDMGQTDKTIVNETLDMAKPAEIGGLTTTEKDTSVVSGTGINLEVYKDLYGEPDKIESSYSARLAVISQKLARDPSRSDAEALKNEQEQLLSDLRTMKATEREEKGSNTPTFDIGSITSHVNEVRRGSLQRYGFKVGINNQIENLTEGNMHKADIAELNVANQLTTRNQGINDPNMSLTAQGIRDTAIQNITDYGWNIYYNNTAKVKPAESNQDFVTGIKKGQYRVGEVVSVSGKVVVYTGVPDFKTGQPFIILTPEMGE